MTNKAPEGTVTSPSRMQGSRAYLEDLPEQPLLTLPPIFTPIIPAIKARKRLQGVVHRVGGHMGEDGADERLVRDAWPCW